MSNRNISITEQTTTENPRAGSRPVFAPLGGFTEFLAVAAASLPLLVVLSLRTALLTYSNPAFKLPTDQHKYILMASSNPFQFHIAPYCWRVLVPLIAKVLPFSLEWNFFLITFISIWMTGVLIYFLAKECGLPSIYGLLGVLLFFSLGFTTKQLLYQFWDSDPLSLLAMTLAIWTILTRKDVLFILVLALGVASREDVLVVAPLYYSLNARRFVDVQLLLKSVLLAIPAVAVFFGLRQLIPSLNHNAAYLRSLPVQDRVVWTGHRHQHTSFDYLQIILTGLRHPLKAITRFLPHVAYSLRSALILLPFLVFFRRFDLLLRFSPFIVLIYAQLLFIDTNRYLIGVFPVFVLLSLFGMKRFVDWLAVDPSYLVGLPLLFIALNLVWMNRIDAPTAVQLAVLIPYLAVLIWIARSTSSRMNTAIQS